MNSHSFLLLALGILASSFSWAQAETVHFDYDNAGNRYIRFVFRNMNADETDSLAQVKEEFQHWEAVEEEAEPVETKAPSEFSLFPNPTRDHIIIDNQFIEVEGDWDYELYSSDGVLMQSGKIRRFPVQIEFSNTPPGNYYLRLTDGEQSATFSIIKL